MSRRLSPSAQLERPTHLGTHASSLDMREALIGIANALGIEWLELHSPHALLLAVQGYVETHNDTMEELAYARNALRDVSEKVLQLEEQVAGLRNRPAPQRPYPWPPQPYPEPLDVPDVVYDPSWGGPTL